MGSKDPDMYFFKTIDLIYLHHRKFTKCKLAKTGKPGTHREALCMLQETSLVN